MTKERFFSSCGMIILTALAIFYEWAFMIMMLGLTIGGLYEFFHMIKKKGIPIYSYFGILIGVFIPLTIYFHFTLTRNWEFLFIFLAFFTVLLFQFARKENTNAIVGISTTMFGVFYVSWLFSFLIRVRDLQEGFAGVKLMAFIIIVTKAGDIGALLVGSLWGKHPLFPRVSPNKSIEGSLGSFGFSTVAAVAGYSLLPAGLMPLWNVALMGAFFGGMGQLGDICESLIKRDCNTKDSGKFLPGLGGVLDIIDSLLFSVPLFYLYMSSILKIM